jgi:hypothetical protein
MTSSIDCTGFFATDYAESRQRLIAGARALAPRHGVCIDSRAIDARGPADETLALDFVIFGARRPRNVLVVSSATHGVEGFCGSAVQHYLIEAVLPTLTLGPQTAVVLQHANNPYGFAWQRRVNESNVDFNRNFCDTFDPDLCDPDYVLLHDDLNPTSLAPEAEAASQARIAAYIAAHGERRFQQAAIGGQYRFPRGMQFGGARIEQGAAHLLALVAEHLGAASTVLWLDFHTGLGAFGDCELVTGAMIDSDCYRFSNQVWQGRVKSANSGESVSTPLNGLLDRGIERSLPSGCRLAFAYPEYGTYEPTRVMRATRNDNWLHHHGDLHDPTGRAIKAEMLESFNPASQTWRQQVVQTGARLVDQALEHLPGANRRSA